MSPAPGWQPLLIKGDTRFNLYDKERLAQRRGICHFWVHTHFLQMCSQGQGRVVLRRRDVDKACKAKYNDKFSPDFEVVLEVELAAQPSAGQAARLEHGSGHGGEDDRRTDPVAEEGTEPELLSPRTHAAETDEDDTDDDDDDEAAPQSTPRGVLGGLSRLSSRAMHVGGGVRATPRPSPGVEA